MPISYLSTTELLGALSAHGVEPEPEALVVEDRPPEHLEVGAEVQVVHLGPAARSDQVALGHRRAASTRPSPTSSSLNSIDVACRLHQSQARGSISANTSSSGRTRKQLSLASTTSSYCSSRCPADEVAREQRPGAEVVRRVRHAPGAAGDALELVELAAVEHPVGEVEDVGDAGPARAGSRRRSRRPRRRGRRPRTGRRGAGPGPVRTASGSRTGGGPGTGGEALVPPDEEVVQQRVHVLGRRVEVAAPVPPEVEVQAGGAQVAPPLVDEVEQRVDAAGGRAGCAATYPASSKAPLSRTTAIAQRRSAPRSGRFCAARARAARRPTPPRRGGERGPGRLGQRAPSARTNARQRCWKSAHRRRPVSRSGMLRLRAGSGRRPDRRRTAGSGPAG